MEVRLGWVVGVAAALALAALGRSASAQEAAPQLATAPPVTPPADDGTWRRHDGFYLRLGIGAGYGRIDSSGELGSRSGELRSDFEAKYSGIGPAYELLLGGTVGSGVVVGGGFVGQDIVDPELETEAFASGENTTLRAEGSIGLLVLGPFIDWFPDPRGGTHVGTMLGIASQGLASGGNDDDWSDGFGGSLWCGYDFWIGKQWSLGAELRAAFLSTRRELDDDPLVDGQIDDVGKSYQLLFSALYH